MASESSTLPKCEWCQQEQHKPDNDGTHQSKYQKQSAYEINLHHRISNKQTRRRGNAKHAGRTATI